MKQFTVNQKSFSLISIVLTISFYYILFTSLGSKNYSVVIISAIGYAITMFLNGFMCGKNDKVKELRIDIGFRYHFLTYVICNSIYLIFIIAIFPNFDVFSFIGQVGGWGIGLIAHYFYSKKSIKGYQKEELF